MSILLIIWQIFLYLGQKRKNDRKNVRIFSEKNKNKFKEALSLINWKQEMKNKSVNEAMTFFYHNLTKAYNKSFPIIEVSIVPQLSKCLKFEAVWGVLTDQMI